MVNLIRGKKRSIVFGLVGIVAGIAAEGAGLSTLSSCTPLSREDHIQFYNYHECAQEMETLIDIHTTAILDYKERIASEIRAAFPEQLQLVRPEDVIDALTEYGLRRVCGQIENEEGLALNAGFIPGRVTYDDSFFMTEEVRSALNYLTERDLIVDGRIDYETIARNYSPGEKLDVLDQVQRVLNPELGGTILHEYTHAAWNYNGEDPHHRFPVDYETDPFYAYGDAAQRVIERVVEEEMRRSFDEN